VTFVPGDPTTDPGPKHLWPRVLVDIPLVTLSGAIDEVPLLAFPGNPMTLALLQLHQIAQRYGITDVRGTLVGRTLTASDWAIAMDPSCPRRALHWTFVVDKGVPVDPRHVQVLVGAN
jgi:hypothetical protein